MAEEPDTIRVLHVDDNPNYTELTKTFLERQNDDIEVTAETSALEALERLRDNGFDCVVSDYEMPNTNGLELLEIVREEHPDLPFILLTGKGGEEIASDAISAGVTDYVQKKGNSEQYEVLANRITNAVDRYRTQQRFWDALSWYERLVTEGLTGVFVVQDDEFVYINERFADIFGRDQEALIGTSPRTLVCESDEGTLADLIGEGGCEEQFRRELTVTCADGTEIPVEIQGGPVQYGGKPGCIGILWD